MNRRRFLETSLLGLCTMLLTERSVADTASSGRALNEQLLNLYVDAINHHDTTNFGQIFSEDYAQRSGKSPPGLDAQIENAKRFFAALPDLKLTVDDRIFEADRIVARCTYTGTHLGVFLGVPPTGRQIQFGTIDIWRVEKGRLAEHWDQVDIAGVLKQPKSS